MQLLSVPGTAPAEAFFDNRSFSEGCCEGCSEVSGETEQALDLFMDGIIDIDSNPFGKDSWI